ncbi:MAG: DoxX family protein [Spirillospora sp.]
MEDFFETLGAEFAVLVISLPALRLLGALGVRRFADWPVCAAHAMAIMLVVTGSVRFVPDSVAATPSADDLAQMVPPFVPFPLAMVYLTAVLELLIAVGLVMNRTRWSAAVGLAVLMPLLLPANINAALNDIPLNGAEATPLWIRVPQQAAYFAIALWVAKSADSAGARRLLNLAKAHLRRRIGRPRAASSWVNPGS